MSGARVEQRLFILPRAELSRSVTAFLVDRQARGLSPRAVEYYACKLGLLQAHLETAGVQVPSLHSFRRAFALACLRGGMDVYSQQKLMGHADPTVLRRYLAQTEAGLQAAHAKSGPVDNLL